MPRDLTTGLDPAIRQRVAAIEKRLAEGLSRADPHRRLAGRPVSYQIIAGRTLEITYKDVPGIADGEIAGLKRLIGEECSCTVSPQTAETVTVRVVVPLQH